ncbi:MAG: PLP-dependent aminotransferase family protein [Longicatena sp.]
MKIKTINFEREGNTALYMQIYKKIQHDILSNYLKKGDQLPSIRKATTLMKVSKTSIERAYEQLAEEGFIISIPQKGYFVDVDLEQVALRNQMKKRSIPTKTDLIRYDFRSQSMDSDSFDMKLWKKYLKEVLDEPMQISTYGDAQGEVILRNALQNYAYSIRGVLCTSEQILIGSSFQSLLYILCGLLPQDCIIGMEETGFIPAETVFFDYGLQVRKLPTHEEGILLKDLQASDVQVLYINSVSQGCNHQPITKKTRQAYIQWAVKTNALIIEDDHNGELRYQSKLTPAMQGFDMGEHIVYIGSFSKLLLPSLRISYMVFTKALQERYLARKNTYSPTSSKIEQLALAHYITDGHLERHVKRLRKRYEQKSHQMLCLLQVYFPDTTLILEEAALQIIVRFHETIDIDAFIEKAKQQYLMIQKNNMNELVLSFAAIKEDEMRDALQVLRACFNAA